MPHPNDPVSNGPTQSKYVRTHTKAGKPIARKHRMPTTPTQAPFTKADIKRLLGRPTTYKPSYCQDVIADLAQGYSLSGFAGKLGTTKTTLLEWMRVHPDFALACASAGHVRLRWWEGKAIEIAETGGVGSQAQMVIFGLKNAGADEWRDKQETAVSVTVTLASLIEDSMKLVSPSTGKTIDVLPSDISDMTPDKPA